MKLVELLHTHYALSDQAAELIRRESTLRDYPRKTTLVSEGERLTEVWFVVGGSVRSYVLREDKCVILYFSFEGDVVTLPLTAVNNSTARYTVETMEPTRLAVLPRDRFEELLRSHVELANWGRLIVERQLLQFEAFFIDLSWMNKCEQYEQILRHYPQLMQRVSLKDLAAFLDLTPQSLSRIRADLK